MGLFNIFKQHVPVKPPDIDLLGGQKSVPRSLFIEEQDPLEQMYAAPLNHTSKGIDEIYYFLQTDYETRGFNDALTNPDQSYCKDNISLIVEDLNILIQKVTTYYEDMLKELDFHIVSRSRAGLIDLVEVLKTRKEVVEKHMDKVSQIRNDMINGTGMMKRIILSYQRGFTRGLSAITLSNILKKEY